MKAGTFFTGLAVLLLLLISSPALGAETYKVDPVHTSCYFRIMHLDIAWVYGRFNNVEGMFTIDKENPEKSSASFEIMAQNVDTNVKKRDDHLRSGDFFNVEESPAITFKSKSFEKSGEKGYRVTGDLTIHGVTRTVAFDVVHTGEGKDPWGNYRSGFSSTFTIDRTDYGIDKLPDLVGKEAEVMFSVEGIRQ